MEVVTVFAIYLILFRLAIIAAAVVSIILGYRLFCKGVWPDAGSGKGTSVDAKIAGSGFTLKNAIFAYEEAVALMAEPMNQLAWLYQEQGKLEGALLLSRMATRLSQNNANYLDTLAEVLFKTGEREEAIDVMEKAAMLNPKYKNKLIRFREGVN